MTLSTQRLFDRFWATGVGSLPHTDAGEAADLVANIFCSQIPFWPQLPRADFFENMYVQFCEQLPGVVVDEENKTIRVRSEGEAYLAAFENCFANIQDANLDYFSISRRAGAGLYALSERLGGVSWQGWVKAQVIGPVSLALSVLDEKKRPILYDADLCEILPSYLGMKAAWLVRQLRVHAETKVIIFVDEPYLVAVGTSQCSLPREEIIRMINRVIASIHEAGALAGVHCCGNTDWEMVMATDIDILNFDAVNYLDKFFLYENAVKKFLKRGGIPALGIVPNNEELEKPDVEEALRRHFEPYRATLSRGAIITTSCGCSGLSEALTRKALELCVQVAERL